jgi:hypothetical protein
MAMTQAEKDSKACECNSDLIYCNMYMTASLSRYWPHVKLMRALTISVYQLSDYKYIGRLTQCPHIHQGGPAEI